VLFGLFGSFREEIGASSLISTFPLFISHQHNDCSAVNRKLILRECCWGLNTMALLHAHGQAWAPRCQCHIWTLADSYTFSTMEEWRCIIHLFFTVYGLSTWLDKYCNVQNKYSIDFYLHHSSMFQKHSKNSSAKISTAACFFRCACSTGLL